MKIGSRLTIVILMLLNVQLFAQMQWQNLETIQDINEYDPDLITYTLEQIDLNYPGLEKVKEANEAGNPVDATIVLLDYYQQNNTAENFRMQKPAASERTIAEADTILKNVFTIQNVKGQVPYLADGHRDWYYKGPNNDREWAWLSNRHSQLREVLQAYYNTGNPKYIEYIDLFLKDFILASMPYPAEKGGESIWRGLEVAARAKRWTELFYGLINDPNLSDASKFLILRSLPDHAHYNRNFHGSNNWLTMEISALATVAAYFPEYQKSPDWMNYTVGVMTESMKDQVYPDGVQTELTSHYHNVSLRNFELFQELCGVAEKELPDYFTNTIEDMYGYIAHAVRPDGHRILNNDGDRGSDVSIISEGAEKFDHPEWQYIITNGNSGTKPDDGPSYFYPWAGHLISRSGFDKDAQWSFFDMGPWGSGHQHNDKLHISIAAYGRDLLVDAGRFAYTGAVAEKFRGYARSTAGHNLVLVDGKGQAPGPTHAVEPIDDQYFKITPDVDYASNSFDEYYDLEGISHTRAVVYVRGSFWVVADRVETEQKRDITTLWHWHPDSEIVTEKKITKSVNPRGNLAVIPVSKGKMKVRLVEGQEQPDLQGWYSPEYNIYGPNTAAIYETRIKKPINLVWLLYPSEAQIPEITAKVISESDQQVTVSVSSVGGNWTIVVPFEDSSKVQVSR